MQHPEDDLLPLFSRRAEAHPASGARLPDGPSLPSTAYQVVRDETMLDGNARLNLATFVTTWMDPEARKLYTQSFDKNIVDKDEYPQTAEIEQRCATILAELWHAPRPADAIGTSTVGSSEACMLAGLALKRRWVEARRAKAKDTSRPNLVMSSAVQVCWEKFCNFFDVEARMVPITEDHRCLDGSSLADVVDENTIGVVAIMGVTYTGRVRAGRRDRGGARPDRGGDRARRAHPHRRRFRRDDRPVPPARPRVGLPVGAGALDQHVGPQVRLGLPRPRLGPLARPIAPAGFADHQRVVSGRVHADVRPELQPAGRPARVRGGARHLAGRGASPGRWHLEVAPFELWNDGSDIPVFAWRLRDAQHNWTLYDLQDQLRMQGWLVPAYPMPDDLADVTVQRIVVRNGLSMDLAERLLLDIRESVHRLEKLPSPLPDRSARSVFHH